MNIDDNDLKYNLGMKALSNVRPRIVRKSSHNVLIPDSVWIIINSKVLNKESSLRFMYESMQQEYKENDLEWFKNFSRFYKSYRNACKHLNLKIIPKVRKPKS